MIPFLALRYRPGLMYCYWTNRTTNSELGIGNGRRRKVKGQRIKVCTRVDRLSADIYIQLMARGSHRNFRYAQWPH